MKGEIGTVAAQCIFWQYMLRIFGISTVQCRLFNLTEPVSLSPLEYEAEQ